MNTIEDIKENLEKTQDITEKKSIVNLTPDIVKEIKNLQITIESILIFLKITDRMTEAQYRFVFSHVKNTKRMDNEEMDDFLTRSAIELEKKMKNMGLLK